MLHSMRKKHLLHKLFYLQTSTAILRNSVVPEGFTLNWTPCIAVDVEKEMFV
jgi:hypothetical protein